jgi:phosphonate transport system substrate-binding protein
VALKGKLVSKKGDSFRRERGRLKHFLVSFFLLLFFSCFVINAQEIKPEPDWPGKITIGFIPSLGPEKTKKKWQPLIDHLEKTLGLKVEAMVPDNYVRLIALLKARQIEFAYFGPQGYVEAHRLIGAEAIAMELDREGNPGYRAIIISSRASKIQSLDQAQGKVLAFADPESTSGYLVPLIYFLRERKQTPASFASRIVFAGSHAAVVEGVAKGKFAAGATNDMDLIRASTSLGLSPEQFNVLWKSELIPGSPFVARKDIPPGLKEAFLHALLSLNQDKDALEKMQIGGFAPAKDSDFNLIRELESLKGK